MRKLASALTLFASTITFAGVTDRHVDLDDFDVINLKGNIDVSVTQSDQFSVIVETEEEWQQWVMVERDGDTLTLRMDPRRPTGFFGDDFDVDVYVQMPQIEEIFIQGSGEIFAETIEADDLELRIDGSGDIVVSAVVATNLDIAVNGSGDIKLANVGAEDVRIKVSGSGDVKVAEINALTIDSVIRGSGDIKVAGSVDGTVVEIYGSGDFDGRYLEVGDTEVTIFGSGDVWLNANSIARQSIRGSGDVHLTRH
ncbi:head GIN domain-containing protein [Umboniibacter marinipuniceus]|uniref:Putative autotransporter adhesin-like protein n=1 Tax=Umboniibacter marinipuniceus TaxID=569599 RepID=A0A3M0ABT5_9GAMM|nr:head GIN domain-containing protein [Umboniibacter marinipuniceus]RMA81029.1 putative autotransporter adhesin-like protein [Umboniibacter marinipuniceus]